MRRQTSRSMRHELGSRGRSRGQIVVLFAGSIVLFVLLCGVVVDIAYYWVGSLQAQRAADAAALAGAVYLPGDTASAYSAAAASATQNGFTTGGATTVHSVQDSANQRQLDVTISTRIGTFFSRVVGLTSWPVTVSAKGVYVLPVPMGSPDAYYGVGTYSVNKTTTTTAYYPDPSHPQTGTTGTAVSPTTWTSPANAWSTANWTTSNTLNQVQAWKTLNIPAIAGATVDGIIVSFNAYVSTTGVNACQVRAEVSWDGTHWGSLPQTSADLTRTAATYYLGGTPPALGQKLSPASSWDGSHTWVAGDFASSKFHLRLTYLKGSCGQLSLNTLRVTVYSETTTSTTSMVTTDGVYDGAGSPPSGGTFLASRGAFGAVITKGGDQSNGDAYSPVNSSLTHNAYNPDGYDYLVKLPAGGTVRVFDPGFCAMGSNGAGGSMGTGDHWIGSSGTSYPVSTYYTVWNTNGKPGLPHTAWTEVYTSGNLFEGETGYDPANMGPNGTGSAPGYATSGCNSNGRDAYHSAWWTIPTGSLAAGTYAIQIQTTKTAHVGVAADASQNQNTNAENMFSLEAMGGADGSGNTPQIYGNGKMVVYNNLMGGSPPPVQKFYLAQIDRATGAGKTALIDLWDIGDIGGTGTLRILSPDGGSQNYVSFRYTTDSSCHSVAGAMTCYSTGTTSPPVTSIVTTLSGAQVTNGTWIHISIPLPATYGTSLWNNGWWQVEYTVTQGGNDTTSWQVSVQGNPVHLLVP
jgi:Flp pilus assembly protein TadG